MVMGESSLSSVMNEVKMRTVVTFICVFMSVYEYVQYGTSLVHLALTFTHARIKCVASRTRKPEGNHPSNESSVLAMFFFWCRSSRTVLLISPSPFSGPCGRSAKRFQAVGQGLAHQRELYGEVAAGMTVIVRSSLGEDSWVCLCGRPFPTPAGNS